MVAPRLLVFDLDGTLIDSSLDLCNAVNAALQSVGRPELPQTMISSYIGDGAQMLVRRALGASRNPNATPPMPDDGLFDRAYEFFLSHYRIHKLDNTRCYDGVLESLTQIRASHPRLCMAVLTNKPVNPSREICSGLGLAPFFFQNYGGNSFTTKKPDPAGLLTLIEEAGSLLGREVMPEETVMIGDSDVDVLTARACRVRSLGCSFGLAPVALAAARPDALVNHASEWRAALGL